MLELVETVAAEVRAQPIGFATEGLAEASEPLLSGDSDLAALLRDLGQLLDADALGLVHVNAAGRAGETLAAVRLSARPVVDGDRVQRALDALDDDRATSSVDDGIAAALLRPRPHDRVALYVVSEAISPAARRATTARLAAFLPLIERGLMLWMKAHVERLLRADQRATLDFLSSGLLIVDGEAAIHFANRPARALLADASDVFDADGRLMLRDVQQAMQLQVALRHLLGAPSRDGTISHRVVMLVGRAGRFPLLLAIQPLGGEHARRRAAIQLIDIEPEPRLPLDAIGDHFDLTQVERRLVEQIVRGRTLAEAADAMRLKEQTARTYLKQIFQKTGLHRQADLVSAMLKSALPLLSA